MTYTGLYCTHIGNCFMNGHLDMLTIIGMQSLVDYTWLRVVCVQRLCCQYMYRYGLWAVLRPLCRHQTGSNYNPDQVTVHQKGVYFHVLLTTTFYLGSVFLGEAIRGENVEDMLAVV